MYSELFSKRYGLRPTPEGLMYEDVPMTARVGLYHLIESHFDRWDQRTGKVYLELYRGICVAMRIPRDRRVTSSFRASSAIEGCCNDCLWWQFYDICEVAWHMLHTELYGSEDEKFASELSTLLREERLGFEFKCTDAPSMTKSMHIALEDLQLSELLVVYPGSRKYKIHPKVTVLPAFSLSGFRAGLSA